MSDYIDFRQTWLWRQAFENPRTDVNVAEQAFFKEHFLSIRERSRHLASRVAADLPMMTVHDISHLDALWETASLVAEGAIELSPAEAFVFGVSVLLHDAAMSLAAYPGGLDQVKATVEWKDAIASFAFTAEERGSVLDVDNLSDETVRVIMPDVLRRLHAIQAEVLAEQCWVGAGGTQQYLIEDSDLRDFYGSTIGKIAHSHWWSIHKVELELSEELGAFAPKTNSRIDRLKLACLLRVADALHLDSRRAPRFLRSLIRPDGNSENHWAFQEKLAKPHIELDAVVFTSGKPFSRDEADAWWLAFETLNAVDRELRDVDLLLQSRGSKVLKARRVKGVGSPEMLVKMMQTRDWRPVDTRLQVSDIPKVVESLGGAKLYGEDPKVALRELIQNAADAIQARRRYEDRPVEWGVIKVELITKSDGNWLIVEDNGIGMSERVLTGPLLDFGTSFWRSPLAMEEFPGLMASGMHAIGRFGIGFFSVFMLGSVVRVYSRRCDCSKDSGRLLEFRGGVAANPILSPSSNSLMLLDGGTRIEVLLRKDPFSEDGGILFSSSRPKKSPTLAQVVGAIAPNLDVLVDVCHEGNTESRVVVPKDWLTIEGIDLIRRLDPFQSAVGHVSLDACRNLMRCIHGSDGVIYGRAFISPWWGESGWITISGLKAERLLNVKGIFLGKALTAVRDRADPLLPAAALSSWATDQADLIASTIKDEDYQAKAAEVVLTCGGKIGKLKIIKWKNEWLDEWEFREWLRNAERIVISFSGYFSYDEFVDDNISPRMFNDYFDQDEEVAIVLSHNGIIFMDRSVGKSRVGMVRDYCIRIINDVWSEVSESEESFAVGCVDGHDVIRNVSIFERVQQEM